MSLSLDEVERHIRRLWQEEARRWPTPRMELLTLVGVASDPAVVARTERALAEVAIVYPSRTVVAKWKAGSPSAVSAGVSLHRADADGPASADAIQLEATGGGRAWLPEAVDRLALSDVPICVWWVGDLPDDDDLFDRLAAGADMVIVNSAEMDLRDLQALANIVTRFQGRCAFTDLAWIRLRSLQDLIARFFDDEASLSCLSRARSLEIAFASRQGDLEVASPQAGLLLGWMVNAFSLGGEPVAWTRGERWAEANVGSVSARLAPVVRDDVPFGSILRVAIDCTNARFEVERQSDPDLFAWSRELPGRPPLSQVLRAVIHEESTLLVRCIERPHRDELLEASLREASRLVRPVALPAPAAPHPAGFVTTP